MFEGSWNVSETFSNWYSEIIFKRDGHAYVSPCESSVFCNRNYTKEYVDVRFAGPQRDSGMCEAHPPGIQDWLSQWRSIAWEPFQESPENSQKLDLYNAAEDSRLVLICSFMSLSGLT